MTRMKKRLVRLFSMLLTAGLLFGLSGPPGIVSVAEAADGTTGPLYDVYQIFTGTFVSSDDWFENARQSTVDDLVNMKRMVRQTEFMPDGVVVPKYYTDQIGNMTQEQYDNWVKAFANYDALADIKWGANAGMSLDFKRYVDAAIEKGQCEPFEIVPGQDADPFAITWAMVHSVAPNGTASLSGTVGTSCFVFKHQWFSFWMKGMVDWTSDPFLSGLTLSELTSVEVPQGYYMIASHPGSVGLHDAATLDMVRVSDGTLDVIPKASAVQCVQRFNDRDLGRAAVLSSFGDHKTVRVVVEMSQPQNLALLDSFYASFNIGLPAGVTASDIRLFWRHEAFDDFLGMRDPYGELVNEYADCCRNCGSAPPEPMASTIMLTCMPEYGYTNMFMPGTPIDADGNVLTDVDSNWEQMQANPAGVGYTGDAWFRPLPDDLYDYLSDSGTFDVSGGFMIDTLRRNSTYFVDNMYGSDGTMGSGRTVGGVNDSQVGYGVNIPNGFIPQGMYYLAFNVSLDESAVTGLYAGDDMVSYACVEWGNDPNQFLRESRTIETEHTLVWDGVSRPVCACYPVGKLDAEYVDISIGRTALSEFAMLDYNMSGLTVYVGSAAGMPVKNAAFRLDCSLNGDLSAYTVSVPDLVVDEAGIGVYRPLWADASTNVTSRLYTPFSSSSQTFSYLTPHSFVLQQKASENPVQLLYSPDGTMLTTDSRGMIHLWGLPAGDYRLTQVTSGDTKGLNMVQPVCFRIDALRDRDGQTAISWLVPESTADDIFWRWVDVGRPQEPEGDSDGIGEQPNSEYLSVHNNYYYLNIPATAGVVLPTTGGSGVMSYLVFGSLLAAGAAIVLVMRQRRKGVGV